MTQETFDIAVVGAGVSGANIARKLSSYKLEVALLEKEADVSFGTSKANSGIVHGGFHHGPGHLKTRLEIQGNLMFDRLQQELGFPYKRCGILVAALNEEELLITQTLYRQGVENGAIGIEMCSRERILELEPKLSPDVLGGLHAPGGGIIEPYRFVFSLVESAVRNGVRLMTCFKVEKAAFDGDFWNISAGDGRRVRARFVVNAAGLYADTVSRVFGAEAYEIEGRKGEYFLLDRMTKACPGKVVFPVPTPVSKGMLVIPTVEGTVLVGPTAEAVRDKEDFATSGPELEKIFDSARRLVPGVLMSDVITTFAGIRPTLAEGDFYIDLSEKVPQFVQVAGIQSPGLTASPAIGEYVKDLLKKAGCELTEKTGFHPLIDKVPRVRDLSPYESDELVKKDPRFGNIVCRCEKVSEAEIVAAIERGHTTLDGVKYFTRSGMGRCQGGFCTYKIIKIIMRETGLPYDQVTKKGGASVLLKDKL